MLDLEERLQEQFASFFTLSRADNLTTEQLQLRMRKKRRDSLLHGKDDEDDDPSSQTLPTMRLCKTNKNPHSVVRVLSSFMQVYEITF